MEEEEETLGEPEGKKTPKEHGPQNQLSKDHRESETERTITELVWY